MLEERAATWPKQWMAQGYQQGHKKGHERGLAEGLRRSVADVCDLLGVELGPERQSQLESRTAEELEELSARLKRERHWT